MKRNHLSPISLVLLALLCFGIAIASEPLASIGGLYEVCIGVKDPVPEIQYWEFFGYRIGETGRLSSERANILYGVDSQVQSIRLYHLDANHVPGPWACPCIRIGL